MRPDAMILGFRMLSFKSAFSHSSFIFFKRLFSWFSVSAIRVVSSAYLEKNRFFKDSHLYFQIFNNIAAIIGTFLFYRLHPWCYVWQKVSPLSLCPYGGWRVGEVDCKCRILSGSSKHRPGTFSISLALALTSWVTWAGYSVFVRLNFLLYKMG